MPLTSFNDILDERYPPGSPERAEFDALGDRLVKRNDRVRALTGWMGRIPPRWEYAEAEVIEGETYRFYHGVGHIAMCFWGDVLDSLLQESYGRGPTNRLKSAFYGALDGLAFHYLDDAYVPTLTDLRNRSAGRRQNAWRRRHAAALVTARQRLADLRAEGFFDAPAGDV